MSPCMVEKARHSNRLFRNIDARTFSVMDESLRHFATAFHSAKALHRLMQGPPTLDSNCIGKESLALLVLHFGYVDIVVGLKNLRLLAQLHFVEIKGKLASAAEPRVIGEERDRSMVGVRVDGPVGKEYVGLLGQQKLTKFFIPAYVQFCV